MEFPEVLTYDEGDEAGAARALAAAIRERDIETPLVVASVHGRALGAKLAGPGAHTIPEPGADQQWAADLGSRAHRAGAGAIVAIGGGRCLDVGKLAAARAGLTLVSVPTQLSHDGICSPVAVVPDASGVAESVGAIAPRAVFISIPTLRYSPVASVRAGLGDLLANPLALRDWALAATRGLEDIDERAWEL